MDSQTVKPYHIVTIDEDNDYAEGDKVCQVENVGGIYPFNLYFNQVKDQVPEYVMFLDDDSEFKDNEAVEKIIAHLGEDKLVMWQVQLGKKLIPGEAIGDRPTFTNICGTGFAYHVKHWVDWSNHRGGDFKVIDKLYDILEPVWIDDPLTGSQNKDGEPGLGKRQDKLEVKHK